MPWEWDWNWGLFGIYAVGMLIIGLILGLIGLPGVFGAVAGGVVGAFAASFNWFEAHGGNNDY